MGLVAWFWDTLVWDAPEETDALELVLAELNRGATLPEALAYASRSIAGLVANRSALSAQGRFSRALEGMARGAPPQFEPWRTLHAAWDAFADRKALADQGFCLVSKLQGRRALRVKCARMGATLALTFLAMAAGCFAIGAWQAGWAPIMTMSYSASAHHLVRDWSMSVGVPALILALAGVALIALYLWARCRTIPSALGGTAPELLFFIGTGLSSGAPLPEVLKRAATVWPGARETERTFLTALAASIESDRPAPDGSTDPAWRLLVHASRQWKAGVLTTESLRFSAMVLADRGRERFAGLAGVTWALGITALTIPIPLLCASLLGGPVGHWLFHWLLGTADLGNLPPSND